MPAFRFVLVLAIVGFAASTRAYDLEAALATDWSELRYVVESTMAEDEQGGTLVVFLHGYGGSADGFRGLARRVLGPQMRAIVPEA